MERTFIPSEHPAQIIRRDTPSAVQAELNIRSEVDSAAKWCGARGYAGTPGDPLPEGLSMRALSRINAFPMLFEEKVARYLHR